MKIFPDMTHTPCRYFSFSDWCLLEYSSGRFCSASWCLAKEMVISFLAVKIMTCKPVSEYTTRVHSVCNGLTKPDEQELGWCSSNSFTWVTEGGDLGTADWGWLAGRCASLCLQAAHGGHAAGGSD